MWRATILLASDPQDILEQSSMRRGETVVWHNKATMSLFKSLWSLAWISKVVRVGTEGRGGEHTAPISWICGICLHNMVLMNFLSFPFFCWRQFTTLCCHRTVEAMAQFSQFTWRGLSCHFDSSPTFPTVTNAFLVREWVHFPPHPHSPAVTRLLATDYLDKIWKEIKGKKPPAAPGP